MDTFKYRCGAFILIMLLSYGCSTTEKTTEEGDVTSSPAEKKASKNKSSEESSELQRLLANQRSSLRDVYATQQNDMPKVFLKKDSSEASTTDDPFEGYRIQLLSTRDVQYADSVANKFRTWADSAFTGYYPRTYVLFSQPFYKVHVGDFQKQDLAYSFSKQLKKEYPGAWVVHDRIEPDMVPADTIQFDQNRNDF